MALKRILFFLLVILCLCSRGQNWPHGQDTVPTNLHHCVRDSLYTLFVNDSTWIKFSVGKRGRINHIEFDTTKYKSIRKIEYKSGDSKILAETDFGKKDGPQVLLVRKSGGIFGLQFNEANHGTVYNYARKGRLAVIRQFNHGQPTGCTWYFDKKGKAYYKVCYK
jgi:hypothetical protein